MVKLTKLEERWMLRLQIAEKIVQDLLLHDGGAYDLEPYQSNNLLLFKSGVMREKSYVFKTGGRDA